MHYRQTCVIKILGTLGYFKGYSQFQLLRNLIDNPANCNFLYPQPIMCYGKAKLTDKGTIR